MCLLFSLFLFVFLSQSITQSQRPIFPREGKKKGNPMGCPRNFCSVSCSRNGLAPGVYCNGNYNQEQINEEYNPLKLVMSCLKGCLVRSFTISLTNGIIKEKNIRMNMKVKPGSTHLLLPFIRKLDLSNNDIESIDLNFFNGFFGLEHLNLSLNPLKSLSYGMLPKLKDLKTLSILSTVPQFKFPFCDLLKLRELNFFEITSCSCDEVLNFFMVRNKFLNIDVDVQVNCENFLSVDTNSHGIDCDITCSELEGFVDESSKNEETVAIPEKVTIPVAVLESRKEKKSRSDVLLIIVIIAVTVVFVIAILVFAKICIVWIKKKHSQSKTNQLELAKTISTSLSSQRYPSLENRYLPPPPSAPPRSLSLNTTLSHYDNGRRDSGVYEEAMYLPATAEKEQDDDYYLDIIPPSPVPENYKELTL